MKVCHNLLEGTPYQRDQLEGTLFPREHQMCRSDNPSREYQLESTPLSSSFEAVLGLKSASLSSPVASALSKVLEEKEEDDWWRKGGRHPLLLQKRERLFDDVANMGSKENLALKLTDRFLKESQPISREENFDEKQVVEKGTKGQMRRFLRMAKRGDQGERKKTERNTATFLRLMLGCTRGSSKKKWECVERLSSTPCNQIFLSCPKARRGSKIFRILK